MPLRHLLQASRRRGRICARLSCLFVLLSLSSCGGGGGGYGTPPPVVVTPPVLAPLAWDGAAATWDNVTWQ